MNPRISLLAFFASMMLGLISLRLIHLQVFQGANYAKAAFNEHYRLVEVNPRRGTIIDRSGRILSVSLACDSLYADPKAIKNPLDVANLLSGIIGGERKYFIDTLSQKNKRFTWIYRCMTPAQSRLLHQWNFTGLYFRQETQRFYPAGQDTGSVTGIASVDNEGLEGIEIAMENHLAGRKGMEILAQDALSRPYQSEQFILKESEPGRDVHLTIDLAIQHFACEILREVIEKERARWAGAVVLDPWTGDILALASEPGYDPNYYSSTSPDQRKNRCVTELVEPGSTFKTITFATALNAGVFDPHEMIDCLGGSIYIGRDSFQDWKKFYKLSSTDVLVHSSNVGTIQIGKKVGGEAISLMSRALGFCTPLEIAIPGSQSGYLRSQHTWSMTATASLSIGYGISTTALHMASAYAAFATRGVRFEPRLIANAAPSPPVRVMNSEASEVLCSILSQVVSRGTGHLGQPQFYSAAGKTGTARRYDPERGGYVQGQIICLFAGFAPVDDPRIALCVVIDDPRESEWASQVAAPVFGQLVDRVLIYLGIPSDTKTNPEPLEGTA